MGLEEYRKKRDFRRTAEPRGRVRGKEANGGSFLVQKHDARQLHYDVRLELDGVLKSWAVPKGPSLDPKDRRLAVHVEDHPLEYGGFEGIIPEGQYGAGTVMLWDRGTWRPIGDPHEGYREGKLKVVLEGSKLKGGWMLVRMGGRAGKEARDNWLLKKERDDEAQPGKGSRLLDERTESVVSGRQMDEIAAEPENVWHGRHESDRKQSGEPAEAVKPKELSGSRRARAPRDAIAPQLATLVKDPPHGDEWIHELKLDGYRLMCRIDRGRVRLFTRNLKDWTARFRGVADAAAQLPVDTALLDGEAVVLDTDGTTNFQALQNALKGGPGRFVTYYIFDFLHLDGYDLRNVPLEERKAAARALLHSSVLAEDPNGAIRYSEHMDGDGAVVLEHACELGVEGIVSKLRDAKYRSGRNRDWVKIKCANRQEFVIGGFTEPSGSRQGFGALLLGVYDGKDGDFRFAGKVGTGFTDASLRELRRRLSKLQRKTPPFVNAPKGREARGVTWVKPQLVAEVRFAGWTDEGVLRQPSFGGLREDLDAAEVRREEPSRSRSQAAGRAAPPASESARATSRDRAASRGRAPARPKSGTPPPRGARVRRDEAVVAGVRLTNPGRIQYPDSGITKLELTSYYESLADWIMPHVADRPLTLVRCPDGVGENCFYQKHPNDTFPNFIHRFPIREKNKTREYLAVDSLQGVIYLVQVGALELHTWNALRDRPEQPDRLIIDLDPGPNVPWPQVVQSARDVRDRLADLGLQSFVKTTGGKGLHVVAPLVRRHSWDDVRTFSRTLVHGLARTSPDRYIATQSKAKRKGKVYLDYVRNARGATAVAAFSTRARPGAPVSLPLRWDQLSARLKPDTFTIRNVPARLARLKEDPWEGYDQTRQSITKEMWRELGVHYPS